MQSIANVVSPFKAYSQLRACGDTRLGKNPSVQLQDHITEEQLVLCWFMTSLGTDLACPKDSPLSFYDVVSASPFGAITRFLFNP